MKVEFYEEERINDSTIRCSYFIDGQYHEYLKASPKEEVMVVSQSKKVDPYQEAIAIMRNRMSIKMSQIMGEPVAPDENVVGVLFAVINVASTMQGTEDDEELALLYKAELQKYLSDKNAKYFYIRTREGLRDLIDVVHGKDPMVEDLENVQEEEYDLESEH